MLVKKIHKPLVLILFSFLLVGLVSCNKKEPIKIGVAFGVGPALRWQQEIEYMEDYAKTLDVELEARLNNDEKKKPFVEDCKELIDSGINVLIVRPRDVNGMKDVVDYAHEHNVKIISYDSLIEGEPIDLFVGYDSEYTGQILGRYLAETVVSGDYILLWGDMNRNVEDMYKGAMKYIEPLDDVNIILEYGVPGWSTEEAKKVIKEAVSENGNQVDAIFAFSDPLAGACAEALAELGVETPVAITGMDAELDAVKRIVAGTQSCTAYMDIEKLAYTTIDEAINLASKQEVNANYQLDNKSGEKVSAYLLERQLVTPENLDRILIDSGYYKKEQVYDEP